MKRIVLNISDDLVEKIDKTNTDIKSFILESIKLRFQESDESHQNECPVSKLIFKKESKDFDNFDKDTWEKF